MSVVIVDTDVVSFTFKRDSRHLLYRPHLDGKSLVLSFMTIAELDLWAFSRNWGARRKADLAAFLQPYVVIESNRQLCRTWAEVRDQVSRIGRVIQVADAWIAATALFYNLPLVTNNPEDFAGISRLTVVSESGK